MSTINDHVNSPEGAKTLVNNLKALVAKDKQVAARLGYPVGNRQLRQTAGKPVEYCYRRGWYPLGMDEAAVESSFEGKDLSRGAFFFGLGLGEHAAAFIEHHPDLPVTIWDRDPWLIRLFLMAHDLSDPIASGRLRIALCADLLDFIEAGQELPVVKHPLLSRIYRNELLLLNGGIGKKRAALCEGELFVDDVAKALRHEGYSVFTLDPVVLSLQEMAHAVDRFKPAFLSVIDYKNGLAEFCSVKGISLLCWEVNPTTDRITPCKANTDSVNIFTYRSSQVPEFEKAGFRNVEYMPLAADPEQRKSIVLDENDTAKYSADLSFVGSSMVEVAETHRKAFLALFERACADDAPALARVPVLMREVLEAQHADFSTFRIPELFHEKFGGIMKKVSLDENGNDPVKLLSEVAASEKRFAYISAFGNRWIRVWGDPGWDMLSGSGVRYMGLAGHKRELSKIYNGTAVNIDINRLYQADIIPMRVFDILACGGFLIAEHSPALKGIFRVGEELETYRTLEEFREKVDYYLKNPQKARSIAKRGMERVRSDHTVAVRVRRMLDCIEGDSIAAGSGGGGTTGRSFKRTSGGADGPGMKHGA